MHRQRQDGRPWQGRGWNAGEINPISSMINSDESLYLYWLAREYYSGAGEIVDAGCLLGGSTICFAKGLKANPGLSRKAKRIHSYDLFTYYDGFRHSILPHSTYREGDSLLPAYLENTRSHESFIEVTPGDVRKATWDGRPIELLFIDLAKSWSINNHLFSQFFGCLIPGRSIVIHQDFYHYYTYWIHLTMQYLSPYFIPLHSTVGGGSVGFLLTRPIPKALLAIDYRSYFTTEHAVRLMDEAARAQHGARRLFILCAKIRLLAERREYAAARALAQEIQESPDWDDWVLYDLVNAENHLDVASDGQDAANRPIGMSRRYNIYAAPGGCRAVLKGMEPVAGGCGIGGGVTAGTLEEIGSLIGERVEPAPAPLPPEYLGNDGESNYLEYRGQVYRLPVTLGEINLTRAEDRRRPGVEIVAKSLSDYMALLRTLARQQAAN